MKKILITGSNGFIGKNLIEFYKNKYEVLTLTRQDNIEDVLKNKPDAIINCAANIYNKEKIFECNVELVYKLLNYVKDNNCKMIQIGSSAEYGKKDYPTKETDMLEPRNIYEATKAAATMLCVGIAKEYSLPVVVARPYSVYGKYEKSYRLFPKLLNAFINDIPMNLNQGYHDFIYIKDFIKGLDILLNEKNEKISGDTVNFGSGVQISNFEILNIFENIYNTKPKNITKIDSFGKSFESDIWVCNTQYAKEKYNFLIDFDIKQGIIDLIKENNATRN